jgi:hypothetical protein
MEGGVVGGEGVGGGKTRLSTPPPVDDPQAHLHETKALVSELLLIAKELSFHRHPPVSLP